MGTLSLVFGLIFILGGIGLLIDGFVPSLPLLHFTNQNILFPLMFLAIMILFGAYLISKYDDDKKKEKSENS